MLAGYLQKMAIALTLCAVGASAAAPFRTWTDNTGNFSVEATLVEVGPASVKLKKADGKIITVPVARLSAADRQSLAALNANSGAAASPLQTKLTLRRLAPRFEFSRRPESFDAMFATLEIRGAPILGMTEYGPVKVTSAQDNKGKDIRLLAAAAAMAPDLRSESHKLHFAPSEDAIEIKMLLTQPTWGATHLASLTGSMRLKHRDLQAVTVDNVLERVGSTLNDPRLRQAARISVARAPKDEVDDIEKTLLVEVRRRKLDAVALELLDGDGNHQPAGRFSFTSGNKTRWGFEADEKLPADTKLKITLGGRPKTTVVPFQFENVSLGPGGSQRRLQEPERGGSFSVFAYAPDGGTIAGGTYAQTNRETREVRLPGQVLLWDPRTGRIVKALGSHDWTVDRLVYSSDGKTLASASGSAKEFTVTTRDSQSGKLNTAREALASPKDSTVKIWDVESGELAQTLTLPTTVVRISDMAISPAGGHLVVVGRRQTAEGAPAVYEGGVWDVASAKLLWKLPDSNEAAITLSPDGKTLAALIAELVDNKVSSRKIHLYDAATGQSKEVVDAASPTIERLAFVSEGRTLVGLGRRSVTFWEIPSGRLIREAPLGSEGRSHGAWAMSPDGRMMAWSDSSGEELELWDMAAGHAVGQVTFEWDDDLDEVAFAPDLKSLVCRRDFSPVLMEIANLDPIQPATDSDVIAALRKIGSVELDNNDVVTELYVRRMDDSASTYIQGLIGLRELSISPSAGITDSQLKCLEGLTRLESLGLRGEAFSNAGLVHLKELVNLKSLYLEGTQITDAGLVHLKGLVNLETLGLKGTQVTDAGLEQLKGLTSLRSLNLRDTQVTDEGARRFHEAHGSIVGVHR